MVELLIGKMHIRVQIWFVALLAVFSYLDKSGICSCSFVAAILHECGHLSVMLLKNCAPEKITFAIGGICIEQGKRQVSPKTEGLILMAGPAVNLLIALLLLLFDRFLLFAKVNLLVGLMQLIPLAPLDGGKLLRLLLAETAGEAVAEKVITLTSSLSLAILCFYLVFVLLNGGWIASFILLLIYLGWLLWKTA